jgi:hypothetical protein
MGTNYYIGDEHLGKSSFGWKFTFRYRANYNSIEDVKKKFKSGQIIDEYREEISFKELWNKIESKQSDRKHSNCIKINDYDFINADFR